MEALLPVEDGAVFACRQSIVTADTNPGIFGQAFSKVIQLIFHGFLKADEIRPLEANDIGHEVLSIGPDVDAIVGILVADVKRHDAKARQGIRSGCRISGQCGCLGLIEVVQFQMTCKGFTEPQ